MAKWIKLVDKQPSEEVVYATLKFSEYGTRWSKEHLLWTIEHGFQPLDLYTNIGAYPINMNVTHWMKLERLDLPMEEAEALVMETEVFFDDPRLEKFAHTYGMEIFAKYGNAIEFIISDISESILLEMRKIFKSNGIHQNVRKNEPTKS